MFFCHFPLLIHFKIPHREGVLFGLQEYWRLGALSSVTDLVKLDTKVCRICPSLILIPLNLTVRITKPFVSPRQWLRKITAHWVLSNANGPLGDLTEQDGSPAFLPPLPRLALSSPLQSFIHALAKQAASSGRTSSLSSHPHCCFRPPANAFLSASSASSLLRVLFSASDMCATENHQTARKGGRSMWSPAHILPRRPLCWRRHTRSLRLALRVVCARACLRARRPAFQSVYLWVSEHAWQGSQRVGVRAGRACKTTSAHPSSPKLLVSGD